MGVFACEKGRDAATLCVATLPARALCVELWAAGSDSIGWE